MSRLLIYLNIPWTFIKQRPQFLAEKLSKHQEVLVYYNKPYKQTYILNQKESEDKVKKVGKPKIPRKSQLLAWADNQIQRFYLRRIMKQEEQVLVMHPDQFEILEPLLEGKQVLYDCMDDYSQFPHLTPSQQQALQKIEDKLIKRADYIFYTSCKLREVHQQRYGNRPNTYIINNAYEPTNLKKIDQKVSDYMSKIPGKKIVYIGAIAEWFDQKTIQYILEHEEGIHVVLFGPCQITLPQHERLHYYGKIPHESVYTAMEEADILMMPFQVTPLIEAVDPIKVYEYLYSGKPVLTVQYKEMDKFKPYIQTYTTKEECLMCIRKPQTLMNRDKFLKQNTWDERARQITEIIQK